MSARRSRLSGLATVTVVSLVAACGTIQNLISPTKGKVEITVKWPQPAPGKYHVMTIPDGTVRIEIAIVGDGIPGGQPLQATVTPGGGNNSTDFLEVPIGAKVVEAYAFDAQSREVAHGEQTIGVLPNQLTMAVVNLVPEAQASSLPVFTPTPDNSASGAASPSPVPSTSPVPGTVIETIAGGGTESAVVDNADPLLARFHSPRALAFDRGGRVLYIADNDNHLIRTYDLTTHAVTTIAHLGGVSDGNGITTLGSANGMAINPADGALYFADGENNQIRKLNRDGSLVAVAGSGKVGADDGPGNVATFNYPVALAFGVDGYLYVADQMNNRVRRIAVGQPDMPVTTFAGTGASGFHGDGGPAVQATVDTPTAVVISPGGTVLYIAEAGDYRLRKVQLGTGIISTAAGTGVSGSDGEGGPAVQARLSLPLALTFHNLGNLFIADGWYTAVGSSAYLRGPDSRILSLGTDGNLDRIAGELGLAYGFTGDGGSPFQAQLNDPSGVVFDDTGVLYIADTYNNRIRAILPQAPAATPTPVPTPYVTPSPAPTSTPTPVPTPTPAPTAAPTATPTTAVTAAPGSSAAAGTH